MMRRYKWLHVFIAFVILMSSVVLFPNRASACDCAMPSNVQAALTKSDAVFEGVVTSRREPFKLYLRSSADPRDWTYKVNPIT